MTKDCVNVTLETFNKAVLWYQKCGFETLVYADNLYLKVNNTYIMVHGMDVNYKAYLYDKGQFVN